MPELRLGLISSAHLEAGWGLTGAQGLRLLPIGWEQQCDPPQGQHCCSINAQHSEPSYVQYELQQP